MHLIVILVRLSFCFEYYIIIASYFPSCPESPKSEQHDDLFLFCGTITLVFKALEQYMLISFQKESLRPQGPFKTRPQTNIKAFSNWHALKQRFYNGR